MDIEELNVLRSVQRILSRYIFAKGFISWDGIRKACERIILALPEEEQKFFKDKAYPEFDIFIPLLRNASAEVCNSKNRATLLFCMNPNINLISSNGKEYIRGREFFSSYRTKENIEENESKYRTDIPFKTMFDCMDFFKSYPSINQQILNLTEHNIQLRSLYFEQNLWNYQYEKKNSTNVTVGIYKLDDRVWTSPYLVDKEKKVRKIPYYAEDPDAMNLARLYVRINNISFSKPIFEYEKDSKNLFCHYYSEMPILLTRALLLCEPKQLTSKKFCTNHPTIPFRNVPEETIKELKRIFCDKAILIR